MTHAYAPSAALPIAADYTALPQYVRNELHDLLDRADNAGTGDDYHQAMTEAALLIGMAVPESRDIAICDCQWDGCGCGAIFDSHLPGVVVTATNSPNCNLSALQCPDCGHDHPRPVQD